MLLSSMLVWVFWLLSCVLPDSDMVVKSEQVWAGWRMQSGASDSSSAAGLRLGSRCTCSVLLAVSSVSPSVLQACIFVWELMKSNWKWSLKAWAMHLHDVHKCVTHKQTNMLHWWHDNVLRDIYKYIYIYIYIYICIRNVYKYTHILEVPVGANERFHPLPPWVPLYILYICKLGETQVFGSMLSSRVEPQ